MDIKNKILKVIPHSEQRYETVGDFFAIKIPSDGDNMNPKYYDGIQITCSDLNNEKYELLVFIHELVEEMLTRHLGIDEPIIKEFDEAFEEERKLGLHSEDDEPGFDERSPYREQHKTATDIEKFVAEKLGINWEEYCKILNEL